MSAPEDTDVPATVRQIVARVGRLDPDRVADADSFADDLGIDSLGKLELVVQVERAFGLRFDDDQAASVGTVGAVVDVVRQLQVGRGR